MERGGTSLDNRIFALQKTKDLPEDLRLLLFHADSVYVQDAEEAAEYLITEIERECQARGIQIFDDPLSRPMNP